MAICNKYNAAPEEFVSAKHTKQRRCCVTLLNRGKSRDWDKWDTLNKSSSTFCSVRHVRYNRKESPDDCPQLVDMMSSIDKISAVVDFSAYRPSELCRFVDYVHGKFQLYVFISTDSVYEVCLEKHHNGRILETDAIRPSLKCDKHRYSRCDKYGHQKLYLYLYL